MLTDVATALQTQARQMTAQFEGMHVGLLGMMGLLGEDREEIMGQCARALVDLEGVMLKFSGDGDKREGVAGEVRMIVNQLAQGHLPGTAEEIVRDAVDEMAEAVGEGTSVTLEVPGSGREPVTLQGKSSGE